METTSPQPASDPVVDFATRSPGMLGLVILVPAVLLLALTGWFIYKGFDLGKPKDEAKPAAKAEDILAEAKAKPSDPSSGDYLWAMVFGVAAAAPLVVVGVAFLTTLPGATAETRTRARVLLLAAGGIVGVVLMVAGLLFFIRWVDGLVKFFDDGTAKDLRWSLYALAMLILGAGSLFVAIQPARAEERHQPMLRRLVYGSNLALVLLLLLTVLVAGNVLAARKVPNTLDTTETGFYTLSPEMTSFLEKLDQKVNAYVILPGAKGELARTFDDTRRMLDKCQEVSRGQLSVRQVPAVSSDPEFQRLGKKYPDVELNGFGVLLTAGENETRHAFIRFNELRSTSGRGPESKEIFVGENRILKELAFLTDNSTKPVVYFTQSNGELQITEPAAGEQFPPDKTARRLKEYLEKNFIEVRPLTFKLETLEIPADATAVVVAQPATPFSKEVESVLRRYVLEPRSDGKKGKIIVLAGTPFPAEGPVPKTGLEALLKELNIGLDDKYLYGERTDDLPPQGMSVMVYPGAVQAGNPVAKAFSRFSIGMIGCRVVNALKDRPAITALPVLITQPGRYNWLEEAPLADPEQAWLDIRKSPELQKQRRLSDGARPVAVFASEGSSSRAAVFGNGFFVSDALAAAVGGGGTPKPFELLGGTIDWLRERPNIAASTGGKAYVDFRLNPPLDAVRLQWIPLAFAIFVIAGIGAGVWAVRRR